MQESEPSLPLGWLLWHPPKSVRKAVMQFSTHNFLQSSWVCVHLLSV